ncbi:hypothetical protein [Kribbella antibiotica]|nr:hypothetical protein [Kribbella antibiotica]
MTSSLYDAVDRVRAFWMVKGSQAELVLAGILLVLAAAAFGTNALL